ncbi:MAG: outer membrane beta-barrel protein, partial [Chitinophagales bacterium]
SAQSSFTFSLEDLPKTLSGVVVTSSKPLMRQEDDKTIIDPENLVAASTNGYEVVEKTPGLFIDQDGNIYISSLSPATVQINGRDMKMSAADVATLLKSIPPTAILKIEILRTPSAKYDASSTGGIVNVVLKKGVKIGITGSVNGGIQQGSYGSQFVGLNINNNNGKKSSSFNVNYNRRNYYEKITNDRQFVPDSVLSQDALTKYPSDAWFGQYILSYAPGKWEIELSGQATLNLADNETNTRNIISKISNGQVRSDNINFIANENKSLVIGAGIEPRLRIDTLGSEWSSNIYYFNSQYTSEQVFTTTYTIPANAVPTGGDGIAENKRDLLSVKSDLKLKMRKKFTLEAGLKSTINNFKNVTNYYDEEGGIRTKNDKRTNTFHYDENINALYLQGSQTFGKDVVLKFGTRLENTNMEGRQIIPRDTSFAIHRTDLFPYIYLSKTVMRIAGFDLRAYLIYRRTITRPVYEQLNPFPRYVDEYLSEVGNPFLRPQFTRNYEANISVNERPLLAVGVNDSKDIFTNVIYQADANPSQGFRTYDNLGKNKEWYVRGLGAIPPGGRYFFVVGGQYNHNFYQGFYENQPLSFKKGTWTFFTYHTFEIDRFSVVTLNGFIRLKGQQQFYELTTFGALNASVNRRFLKEKLIVTLSANDMFFTNKNNFTIKQGSVDAKGYREADTRRFGVNLRYNFGFHKKEENSNMFNVESPEKTN